MIEPLKRNFSLFLFLQTSRFNVCVFVFFIDAAPELLFASEENEFSSAKMNLTSERREVI